MDCSFREEQTCRLRCGRRWLLWRVYRPGRWVLYVRWVWKRLRQLLVIVRGLGIPVWQDYPAALVPPDSSVEDM